MLCKILKDHDLLPYPYVAWSEVECKWNPPPSDLYILCDEVHVWRIQLDLPICKVKSLEQTLCFDELSKANKFYSYTDQQRYKTSRGSLRKILSKYIDSEPSELQFAYSASGKPSLSSELNKGLLCFNLSHSNQYALCTVTLNRSIGIDLEYIHPAPDMLSMAKHYFSPDEYETLLSLPPDMRQQAFYSLWTLKEAYLKATGEGIEGLRDVEVILSPSDPMISVMDKNNKKEICWKIQLFTPADNYSAGLVVKGRDDMKYKFYNFEQQ